MPKRKRGITGDAASRREAIRERERRVVETEEERSRRLSTMAQRGQERRAEETEEQRNRGLAKKRNYRGVASRREEIRKHERRVVETEEERSRRLSTMAQRGQDSRAEETEEQRNSRLSDMAQRGQERRAEETEEQRKENTFWGEQYAEADTFFCFTNLMSEIRDFFIKTLDHSASGIGAMMKRLMDMVEEHDFNIWQRLQMQDIKPQYFCFRWITLLLSQEFPLPDLIRVWDSLFADKNRFQFLLCVCCAMIIWLRDKIMHNDFPSNMKLLQNFPNVDIHCLLEKAVELQR
ncbi:TBC1 domain family member 13 [Araneus ventricosus]|uniref:TBC1 domain family member 13 n=1 Tax=Araneus ventricosus TaxID=182803 RepID=A0A4Y2V6D5_ARAVE|nr:TBC1 domain family member 13 [Araneus ventricosus]